MRPKLIIYVKLFVSKYNNEKERDKKKQISLIEPKKK